MYEQYAWILFFAVFMVMYGEVAHLADLKSPASVKGATMSGQVLSLLSVVYGSSASWSSIVSDYYVQYPVNTSKTKVFLMTTFGIAIPTCIGMLLGCCVGSTMGINEQWKSTYEDSGVGELIKIILYPQGFAKFLLVLLVLSGSMNSFSVLYLPAPDLLTIETSWNKLHRHLLLLLVNPTVCKAARNYSTYLLDNRRLRLHPSLRHRRSRPPPRRP